jgi:hypothetical protein
MKKLDNRTFGSYRDKLIVETVEKFRCLDIEQLQVMFFNATCNKESAKRQCENRCKKLSEKKKLIKKWRMDLDQPYKYFAEDFAQKEHICLLNWLVIRYILKNPYEKIYSMDYQRNFKILIPDLYMVTYNPFNKGKEYQPIMFEMDNTITNKFDKVKKYNLLAERTSVKNFPKIIIGTTSESRLLEINKIIRKENRNNLTFQTYLISIVKEECRNAKIKDFGDKFVCSDNNESQLRLC